MPMTVPASGRSLDVGMLGSPTPVDVLYEAESPVVYTVRSAAGQDMLAYLADESAGVAWVLLAPTSEHSVDLLRSGRLGVREALEASWLWLAQTDGTAWKAAWAVTCDDLPDMHLPLPGTSLVLEGDPLIATRAIGELIRDRHTPASVVAFVADATRKAVKAVVEHVREVKRSGRPTDDLRAAYDLPVRRFAFGSFEIAFDAPVGLSEDEDAGRALDLLRGGLQWASESSDSPFAASDDKEREAVLRAILLLTPPLSGPIEQVEIKGDLMPGKGALLTRGSRRRVHREIKRSQNERVTQLDGRIGELDRDSLTFALRDTGRGSDVRVVLPEQWLDDVLDFFADETTVRVYGVERGGRLHAALVEPKASEPPPPVVPPPAAG